MAQKKILGGLVAGAGAWFLLSGLIGNDMGGIVRLGYNPDLPMSFSLAPVRFLLGVALYGAMIVIGIRTVLQAGKAETRAPR